MATPTEIRDRHYFVRRYVDQNRWPGRMTMCQAGRAVAIVVALAGIAFSAKAQDGDIAAGHAFAREACKACHMVEAEEGSSRMIVIGPAFRDIANTPGMTATAIRVFLTSSHPKCQT
jgi:mono/diheme cytochrome c family protein